MSISSFYLVEIMERIQVKYLLTTEYGQEPQKATVDSAGYDLFAAHAKTILPGQSAMISLDLRWAVPKGFCGRILSRSSLITSHNVTVEGGLIDCDYRGIVNVIIFNHHSSKCFTVREGERLAQVVFMRRFDADFQKVEKVSELGITERQEGGFGSTGKTVIKKMRFEEEEDLEIKSEEAILTENDKVILHEKIEN